MREEWQHTGGAVYYSIFENAAKEPPSPSDLEKWEANADLPDDLPFRVLDDGARKIPTAFAGDFGTLPFIAILDDEMVVRLKGGGVDHMTIYSTMDQLIAE